MTYTALLKQHLTCVFEEQTNHWKLEHFHRVMHQLAHFSTQGKLLRGSLFLEIVLSQEHQSSNAYYNIASGIEIIHTAFLIHDDIMDQASERRGSLTLHKEWAIQEGILSASQNHYGISQAISIGDIALFLGQSLVSQGLGELGRTDLQIFLQYEWMQVCFGQMEDMFLSSTDFSMNTTDQDIIDVYIKKTAHYTFSVPLVLAAKLMNLPNSLSEDIYSAGELIGILYQIQDDYLDLFGDAIHTKKSLMQDIAEGKKTLYVQTLFRNLDEHDKEIFLNLIRKQQTQESISWIKHKMKDHTIPAKVNHIVTQYQKKAASLLPRFQEYPDIYNFLEFLVDNVHRKG